MKAHDNTSKLDFKKSTLTELNDDQLLQIDGGGDTIDLISLIIRNWTRPILY